MMLNCQKNGKIKIGVKLNVYFKKEMEEMIQSLHEVYVHVSFFLIMKNEFKATLRAGCSAIGSSQMGHRKCFDTK